jgi:hypothetical protein
MASQLASFLVSNGANDARQAKPGADKQGGADQADRQGRKNRNAPNQEAARPDDGPPAGEGGRQGRKRLTRPGEPAEEARPVANTPGEAFIERGGDGHKPKRLGKPGRPGTEEPSLANEPPKEPAKAEPGADDKAKGETTAKGEPAKSDVEGRSGNEAKSEPSKMEAPKTDAPKDNAAADKPVVHHDPAPPVTPAPPAAASVPAPTPAPAVASGGSSEPAAPAARQPAPVAASEPQAVTASAPPPSPPGPPAPPISR